MVSKAEIIKYGGGVVDFDIIDSTGSNIDDLKNAEGLNCPYALIARTLTEGKGQKGRSFACPLDKGLYFSIALDARRIDIPQLVTPAAAVIAARAIEKAYGKSVGIKWVNDLYYNNKKVAGILSEAVTGADGKIEKIIVGAGINVMYSPALPSVAGPLFGKDENADINILAAEMLKGFVLLDSGGTGLNARYFSERILPEYKSRSVILGRGITLERGGKTERVTACDIDSNGALIILTAAGKTEKVIAGEVKITF